MTRFAVIFLGLFLLAAAENADEGTAVSVEFRPQEAKLGETVELIITARGEEGVLYKLPQELDLGPFVELGREGKKKGDQYIFTLKVVVYEEVGEVELPGFQLEAEKPGADADAVKALEVPAAKLTIKSMLAGVEKPEPRDVAGPVPVWVSDYRLLVYLGLAFLFAFGAWILRRSRPVGRAEQRLVDLPPPRLAHQIAYDKLHRIVEDDLLKKGKFREYFIRVSETVREYLGNRYGFFAMDLTSRELVDELRDRPTPGLEIASLKTLLQNSDLVKFAKQKPTDEMSSGAIDSAYSLVNATRRIEEDESDQSRETA
jgi:hypothetical protein